SAFMRLAASSAVALPPNMTSCPAAPSRCPSALPRLPAPMIPILIRPMLPEAGPQPSAWLHVLRLATPLRSQSRPVAYWLPAYPRTAVGLGAAVPGRGGDARASTSAVLRCGGGGIELQPRRGAPAYGPAPAERRHPTARARARHQAAHAHHA